jgi:hypothetical protein
MFNIVAGSFSRYASLGRHHIAVNSEAQKNFRVADDPGSLSSMTTSTFIGNNLPFRKHNFRLARDPRTITNAAARSDVSLPRQKISEETEQGTRNEAAWRRN